MSSLSFTPDLTPSQMLRQGIFGGSYFGVEKFESKYNYSILFNTFDDDITEDMYLGDKYRPKLNKFNVRSGMPYQYWKDMGWMNERDPFGWFEWYCKYFSGMRGDDDDRQIIRWQNFSGVKGRWRNRIYSRINETKDWNISPVIQQSLLHWGYMVNEYDYELWFDLNKRM